MDGSTLVSFVEMASVSNDGYIAEKVNRVLSEVRKGGYTYFAENDIIIAKITPCMENGKCAIAMDLTNEIGFGSSEFHVFRCNNKVRPEFLFGYLNRSKIRNKAADSMTGASGHRRVPIEFYENLEIPLPDSDKQNEIVARVKEIENQIAIQEEKLKLIQNKTTEILNKYLQ